MTTYEGWLTEVRDRLKSMSVACAHMLFVLSSRQSHLRK